MAFPPFYAYASVYDAVPKRDDALVDPFFDARAFEPASHDHGVVFSTYEPPLHSFLFSPPGAYVGPAGTATTMATMTAEDTLAIDATGHSGHSTLQPTPETSGPQSVIDPTFNTSPPLAISNHQGPGIEDLVTPYYILSEPTPPQLNYSLAPPSAGLHHPGMSDTSTPLFDPLPLVQTVDPRALSINTASPPELDYSSSTNTSPTSTVSSLSVATPDSFHPAHLPESVVNTTNDNTLGPIRTKEDRKQPRPSGGRIYYDCEFCPIRIADRRSNLTRHVRTQHGLAPLIECKLAPLGCPYRHRRKDDVDAHMFLVHDIPTPKMRKAGVVGAPLPTIVSQNSKNKAQGSFSKGKSRA